MTDLHLHRVLDEASAHLHPPDLTVRALEGARRRRAARRTAVAGVAASAVAVAAVLGLGVDRGRTPPGPGQTPSPPPSQTEQQDPTELPIPPIVDESVIQPLWDPETVSSLPQLDQGPLPRLDPPASAPALTATSRARAAVLRDGLLFVVAEDGDWRMTTLPEEQAPGVAYDLALSHDGTLLSVTGTTGLLSLDVPSGRWWRTRYPEGFQSGSAYGMSIRARDAGSVWLADANAWWRVDVQGGGAERLRLPERVGAVAFGPGDLVVSQGLRAGRSRTIEVTTPGREEPQVFRSDYLQALSGPATDGESLAAMRGVGGWMPPKEGFEHNGLIALELDDLRTRAYLPVRDPGYAYSDGGAMQAIAWLDPDTVLASVISREGGYDFGDRTLFTWHVETGDLRRVTALAASLPYDVAVDLLRPE